MEDEDGKWLPMGPARPTSFRAIDTWHLEGKSSILVPEDTSHHRNPSWKRKKP